MTAPRWLRAAGIAAAVYLLGRVAAKALDTALEQPQGPSSPGGDHGSRQHTPNR